MLNFREMTLSDKPAMDRLFCKLQSELSDYTFTNFYMWRHTYGLKVAYDESLDCWFFLAQPKRWKSFFFAPVGDWSDGQKLNEAIRKMFEYCESHQLQFFCRRVPEWFVARAKAMDSRIRSREDRNTFDYVYNTTDLIDLAGRKFHNKRNHLNQFLRNYTWEYQPMDEGVVKECLHLETDWFNLHTDEKGAKISGEIRAMQEVMHNFTALGLVGAVIRIAGKIEALTVGEKLNATTAVIHIEKANIEYKGIYAAINQQFVANQWSDTQFINREEDMGIDGLRQAKMSYNPVNLVRKYNIYR